MEREVNKSQAATGIVFRSQLRAEAATPMVQSNAFAFTIFLPR